MLKGDNMLKYSVLMSVYVNDNADYLVDSINSMINQTIVPAEIVIIKDGPLTYGLDAALEKFKREYPKLIKIYGYEENRGLGEALKFGVLNCTHELIARMDADDISILDRCEKQLAIFEQDDTIDMVGGHIAEFISSQEEIVSIRKVPIFDNSIKENMKYRCPFNHMTVMFKKKSVLKSGNYDSWFWNEDYYLWIRMMQNNCSFRNIDKILVNVRIGKEMFKRRGGKKYFQSERKLQKYMLNNGIINFHTYLINVSKRWIVQCLLPNNVRALVFKRFARENV